MSTSQSRASPGDATSVLVRVLMVIGALLGLAFLAVLLSGTADASDQTSDADHTTRLLSSVAEPIQQVASDTAPLVEQVTKPLEPVVSPVVRPVAEAVEPVLQIVGPVTEPVTRPVLDALSPITDPVARTVGAEPVIEAVGGQRAQPEPAPAPASRADVGTDLERFAALGARPELNGVHSGPVPNVGPSWTLLAARNEPIPDRTAQPDELSAGSVSGLGGGGGPALPSGPSAGGIVGSMSAGSAGSHGGEHAVTETAMTMPGTDRAWRAPPDDRRSVPWPDEYGNDHPS